MIPERGCIEVNKSKKWVIIGAALAVLLLFSAASRLYVDWLWFNSLGYAAVFKISLLNKWGLGIAVFLFAFVFLYVNLALTGRYLDQQIKPTNDDGREIIYDDRPGWDNVWRSTNTNLAYAFLAFLISLPLGMYGAEKWITVQQYINRVAFNLRDPIFNRDIGFYVFDLQLYQVVYNILMPVLIAAAIAVGLVYLLMASFKLISFNLRELNWPKAHLIVLLSLVFLCKSWGYKLASYGILYSSNGVVHGAGYTDVHARLLAYKVLVVLTIVIAIILLLNLIIKRMNWVLLSLGIWVGAVVVLGSAYPAIVQKLSV